MSNNITAENVANSPFQVPGTSDVASTDHYLRPWEYPQHSSYFVDIDNTEQAYHSFIDVASHWKIPFSGQSVVVAGHDGCGKTSLLNRCAAYLNTKFKDTLIIPLNCRLLGKTREQVASSVSSHLIDALCDVDGLLSEVDRKLLETRGLTAVSSLLKQRGRSMVLLLPPIEVYDHLVELFDKIPSRHTCMMIEFSNPSITEQCRKQHSISASRPVVLLEVGPLRLEDGWRFIEERQKCPDTVPLSIERSAIDRFIQVRARGRFRVTVREFERLCHKLWLRHKAATGPIGYEDLADVYMETQE